MLYPLSYEGLPGCHRDVGESTGSGAFGPKRIQGALVPTAMM